MSTMLVADITGQVVGNYGKAITMLVVDTAGVPVSLAGYLSTGGNTMVLRSPDQLKIVSRGLSFDTSSGASGIVTALLISGDLDRPGLWECQLVFNDTSPAVSKTEKFIMDVEGALS